MFGVYFHRKCKEPSNPRSSSKEIGAWPSHRKECLLTQAFFGFCGSWAKKRARALKSRGTELAFSAILAASFGVSSNRGVRKEDEK